MVGWTVELESEIVWNADGRCRCVKWML